MTADERSRAHDQDQRDNNTSFGPRLRIVCALLVAVFGQMVFFVQSAAHSVAFADPTCYTGCAPTFQPPAQVNPPPPPTPKVTTSATHVGESPRLELSSSVIKPGQSTIASGVGCLAGQKVVLSIGGQTVGTTRADAKGRFSVAITPPDQNPGVVTVIATCGAVQMSTQLRIVATTSALSTPEASAGVFAVFLVLGVVLLRGQYSNKSKRKKHRRGASDILQSENG